MISISPNQIVVPFGCFGYALVVILCSDCFHNEGLRLEAEKLGKFLSSPCPNCGSTKGGKLDELQLQELGARFFYEGSRTLSNRPSVYKSAGPFAVHEIEFDPTLRGDYQLLKTYCPLQLNAPSTRRLGYTDIYWEIDDILRRDALTELDKPFSKIVQACGLVSLKTGATIYRVRTDPSNLFSNLEFDTPPLTVLRRAGRFNKLGFPVFYGSFEIETCLHECGVQAGQDVILATLQTTRDQTILNIPVLSQSHPIVR